MKWDKDDTKAFIIGVVASMAAVATWDVVKKSLGILNYAVKDVVEPVIKPINNRLKGPIIKPTPSQEPSKKLKN
mgnify:CR=1 FL=1